MFPKRGCTVRFGRVNKKKWRLIDDDVIVSLIRNFKTQQWVNRVIEEGICASSKAITRSLVIEQPIPVLDLANKTALPKRLGTHVINCTCHVERSETSLDILESIGD